MLYTYFYISVHLHLFISVFLCPYVNEVGGPDIRANSSLHAALELLSLNKCLRLFHP